MRLGREVVLAAAGTSLMLRWRTTKNGDPSEATWPAALLRAWRAWLRTWRPAFIGAGDDDAVWLAKDGGPLGISGIRVAFAHRTRAAFGCALRPHMWHTLYATSVLAENPALASAVSTMLDHRHPRSLAPYALDARSAGAATTLDRSLASMRAQVTERLSGREASRSIHGQARQLMSDFASSGAAWRCESSRKQRRAAVRADAVVRSGGSHRPCADPR